LEELQETYISGLPFLDQERAHLNYERQIWLLLKRLFDYRLSSEGSLTETTEEKRRMTLEQELESIKSDPSCVFSDLVVVNRLLEKDRELKECFLVKGWLEDIMGDFVPVELRKGYLENTRRILSRNERQSFKAAKDAEEKKWIVELDPDAPLKYPSKILHPHDQSYENALTKSLFEYIRRGMIVEAIQLCRDADESWRAAILAGALYYHDAKLAGPPGITITGNIHRRLWKETCYHLSNQSLGSLYERAIYGVLCGHVTQVLPVCENWEDELWAYYSGLIETKLESYFDHIASRPMLSMMMDAGPLIKDVMTPQRVFSRLRITNDRVEERYHMIQSKLILNEMDILIRDMRGYLEASQQMKQDTIIEQQYLIRFMAQLVLVLRQLGGESIVTAMPEKEDTDTLLSLYIQYLINSEQNNMVAFYTSMLPEDLQIDAYSAFCLGTFQKGERGEKERDLSTRGG
jgi:nuclear pore complex protein Nup107